MTRARFSIALLALLGGCGLVLSPDDHLGGGTDAGSRDADTNPVDASVAIDAGTDAGLPPECSISADCGGGSLVQCIDRRCRFCAASTGDAFEVRSGTGLLPYLALGVRARPAAPPVAAIATLGAALTVPSRVAVFEVGTEVVAEIEVDPVVQGLCEAEALTTSFSLLPEPSTGTTGFVVQALATGPDNGSQITYLRLNQSGSAYALEPAGYTCHTSLMGGTFLPSGSLARDRAGTAVSWGVHRELTPDGEISLVRTDSGYANEAVELGRFRGGAGAPLPADPYVALREAERFTYFSEPSAERVVLFTPYDFEPSDSVEDLQGPTRIDTPDRSGEASIVRLAAGDPEQYLVAYPVGRAVRFVTIECDTWCRPTGEGAAELTTLSSSVLAVHLRLVGDVPVLVTVESQDDGTGLIALRVLRASRLGYDAPDGGRALAIAQLPRVEDVLDVRFDALAGSTSHYVVAWMERDGTGSRAVAQTFRGTCDP